jgi:hypothetical protein
MCIEEEEAFPRFQDDDPNNWELNDYGREEARYFGLDEATLTWGDMDNERLENWFVGKYHSRYYGVISCANKKQGCMSQ